MLSIKKEPQTSYTKKTCKCLSCGSVKINCGRGLCGTCHRRESKLPDFNERFKSSRSEKFIQGFRCKKCRTRAKNNGRGLCGTCYLKESKKPDFKNKWKTVKTEPLESSPAKKHNSIVKIEQEEAKKTFVCKECKQQGRHNGRGLCSKCYHVLIRIPQMKPRQSIIRCIQCSQQARHEAHGMCKSCYHIVPVKTTAKRNRFSIQPKIEHFVKTEPVDEEPFEQKSLMSRENLNQSSTEDRQKRANKTTNMSRKESLYRFASSFVQLLNSVDNYVCL